MLPYTAINGSSVPGNRPEIVKRQPKVGEADYHVKALQFVQGQRPRHLAGQKVNFFQTFNGRPHGGSVPGRRRQRRTAARLQPRSLGPANLEADRRSEQRNFVYQRFQRGIMHYDTACKCTQGLLLADYLKSILTLHNLPPDLAAQAQKSPFYGQVDPTRPGWLKPAFPAPTSDLRRRRTLPSAAEAARRRRRRSQLRAARPVPIGVQPDTPTPVVGPTPTPRRAAPLDSRAPRACSGKGIVFVDPGMAARRSAPAIKFDDGTTLVEKDLNLKVAIRLVALLEEAGIGVVRQSHGGCPGEHHPRPDQRHQDQPDRRSSGPR